MIAGDYLKNNTLLLGGSGTLGKTIINSNLFKNLKPCDKSKILKKLNFKMATDASLNINKLKLIK